MQQESESFHVDAPPVLGTWLRVYVAVIFYLVLLIGFLWLITRMLAF